MAPGERLKGIEMFVRTAGAGSFTAAAAHMNLTTSAVSKGVARLEKRLGAKLFERTTRSLSLTDSGRAFLHTCNDILGQLEEAEGMLADERAAPMGTLRMDLPVTFGRLKVLPLLLRYSELHPQVRPHLSFTDRFVDIVEEGIDVAVRIGGPTTWPEGLGHRHLGTEQVVFCASPDYLARRGTPGSFMELQTHDAVVYGKSDGSSSPWRYPANSDPDQQRRIERFVFGNAEAQVSAVVAGHGVSQFATWLVADELDRGSLVQVLPQLATAGLTLSLVWRRNRESLPKVASVLAHLSDSLRIE